MQQFNGLNMSRFFWISGWWQGLTLPVPLPNKKRKLTLIFIFILLCGPSKGFVKFLKAFEKPFEAPQKSVKMKIQVSFYIVLKQLSEMYWAVKVKMLSPLLVMPPTW